MNSEMRKNVFSCYVATVDEEIIILKKRISDELKKIDDDASSRQGKSDVGDVGEMCNYQNITRAVVRCLNEQIQNLVELKQTLKNGLEASGNTVDVWSIVSVEYFKGEEKIEKTFFIVPALPGKTVYKDEKYSICSLSFDTKLAKSLIGNKKDDLISSNFNGAELDGKIIDIF